MKKIKMEEIVKKWVKNYYTTEKEFSLKHPKLYKANLEFFEAVNDLLSEIVDYAVKWFSQHPKSETFVVFDYNQLSCWTQIIVKFTRNGEVFIFKAYRYSDNYKVGEQALYIKDLLTEKI